MIFQRIIIYSLSKNYVLQEISILIIIYILYFLLKKDTDIEKRKTFIEMDILEKYEKYFEYTRKLIDFMDGFHFTYSPKN